MATAIAEGLRHSGQLADNALSRPSPYDGPVDCEIPVRLRVTVKCDFEAGQANELQRVPVVAVLASVALIVFTVVLELAFPEKVLPVLLIILGSTCLLVWTSALLAQRALRLRPYRDGTALPLRMPRFPWLTSLGPLILAVIFISEDSRPQLLSTSRW